MNEDARTGFEVAEIKRDLVENLFYLQAKFPEVATRHDWYVAVAYTVRDRLLNRWVKSAHSYYEHKARTVCYLSAEFLIGPQLGMNLLRLNSYDAFREAARELGLNRPGQRRTWTARCLLHGIDGDLAGAGHRVRHPLRVRHLRSGNP